MLLMQSAHARLQGGIQDPLNKVYPSMHSVQKPVLLGEQALQTSGQVVHSPDWVM